MSAPFAHPYRTAPDTLAAIRADLDEMLGRVARAGATPDPFLTSDAVAALARKGRELYTRRALEHAAEHAAAMLPALGLPRLVGPGFAPVDHIGIADAVAAAIEALDAIDGDPDAEPWLGWTGAAIGAAMTGDALDREAEPEHDEDDGTGEPSLASPERHPMVPSWKAGWSYVDRGPDSSQLRWAEGAQHDRELDPCDGPHDDDELDEDGLSKGEGDRADDEATLGAPEGDGDQRRWAQGSTISDDPEADDADLKPRISTGAAWVFGPSRREAAYA